MEQRVLVLDTNAFRGLPRSDVDRLASMGWTFKVSEVALSETWAASVRALEAGLPRDRSRGLLFKRAKLFARHVDGEYPIALAGEHAFERVRCATSVDGVEPAATAQHTAYLRQVWRVLVGIEFLDEEWIDAGQRAEVWLSELDATLHGLARREEELWVNASAPVLDKREAWSALDEGEKLAFVIGYLRTTLRVDDAMFDRLDAHVRFLAWRLHRAAGGAEMTKENDAADFRVLVHLGEGFPILSGDNSFVRLVDESGTHQAPWVRRVADLDLPMPPSPPWGSEARSIAGMFRRSR